MCLIITMSSIKCEAHPTQSLEFFCQVCSDVICMSCVLSPQHRAHSDNITDMDSALSDHQARLEISISQANGCLQGAENVMDNLARCVEELKGNRSRAEQKIKRYFHRMRSILVDREHQFISLLRQNVDEKRKMVTERRKKAKETTDGIITGLKSLTDLTNRNDVMILREAAPILDLLSKHIDAINSHNDKFDFDSSVTMPCFEDPNFEKVCRLVGDPNYRVCDCHLSESESVSGDQNETISSTSPPPVPPRLSIKDTIDFLSPPSPTGSNASDVDSMDDVPPPLPPKSPKKKRKIPQWIEDYKVQMKPQIVESANEVVQPVAKARTKVKFKSSSSDSNSHPLSVQLTQPQGNNVDHVTEVTSKMMHGWKDSREENIFPCGVCLGTNNTLIVTDITNGTVRILKETGRFLDYIGEYDYNECIDCPIAVTTDSLGNLFVADNSSLKLLKFTETGKFVSKLISKSPRVGDIHGVVVTHDGHILTSDWVKSCVHIFDLSGKYIKHFSPLESNLTFQPTGLTLDNRGRLVVADRAGHHIWIFTPDGDLLSHFGWEGHGPGDLYLPYGVAVNAEGQIVVSESGNHRVSVFMDTGHLVQCYGEEGSDVGQFQCPMDICLVSNNKVVATDRDNGRLQILNLY